jgi:hypothetical protein
MSLSPAVTEASVWSHFTVRDNKADVFRPFEKQHPSRKI